MTLNIFYGGASRADVVGLEEGEHSTRRIADALGWFASERLQIVSRYRLIDPPEGRGRYALVELAPGRVVALGNVHLPSDPYGPYLVRDGGSAEELRELELSVRLPAIQEQLTVLPRLSAKSIPVFLTGDFNSPSHLDWTAEVAAVRADVRFPFDWPVSRALAEAGLRDSYRRVHPDPVAVPGFTWTSGGPESVENEVHDRIDWVLAAGRARAVKSEIVGEVGGPDVDIGVDPYPTDHRGVVSTFIVKPGRPPVFVAVETRRLTIGERLSVVFHAPGSRGERAAVVPAGGTAADALAPRSTGAGSPTDGTCSSPRGDCDAAPTRPSSSTSAARFSRAARSGSTGPESRPGSSPPGGSIGRERRSGSPGRTRPGCAGTGSRSTVSGKAGRPRRRPRAMPPSAGTETTSCTSTRVRRRGPDVLHGGLVHGERSLAPRAGQV